MYGINPFPNDLRFRNIENFSRFIQLLDGLLIKSYTKHRCFRIVSRAPHFFLIADNFTSFCSDNNNITYVATYVKLFFTNLNREEVNRKQANLFFVISLIKYPDRECV